MIIEKWFKFRLKKLHLLLQTLPELAGYWSCSVSTTAAAEFSSAEESDAIWKRV